MSSLVDARDHTSGALLATLPSSLLPSLNQPHVAGLSRQLCTIFVAEGRLTEAEAEHVDFELRESDGGRSPEFKP